MSGCLDKVQCSCDWFEPVKEWLRPKRNMLASIIAGTLTYQTLHEIGSRFYGESLVQRLTVLAIFSIGWWFVIDACAERTEPLYAAFHICGIFSTIALLMINAVSTGQITGDMYTEGCLGRKGARAWLFVGFVFAFGGLIGSLWILVQEFLVPAVTENCTSTSTNSTVTTVNTPTPTPVHVLGSSNSSCPPGFPYWWQGIAFFLQNLFIFLSSLIFKFGRTEEEVW